jgi:hypothetical protein
MSNEGQAKAANRSNPGDGPISAPEDVDFRAVLQAVRDERQTSVGGSRVLRYPSDAHATTSRSINHDVD